MALNGDQIRSRGELKRLIVEVLEEPGTVRHAGITVYSELAVDHPAPSAGAVVYVIGDNGAGKRALRIRFPTGAPLTISTEV